MILGSNGLGRSSAVARATRLTDAPADFIDKLLRAVVGIEIPIERLDGKLMASQDEALQDRLGTVAGLVAEGTENAAAMASVVERTLRGREDV